MSNINIIISTNIDTDIKISTKKRTDLSIGTNIRTGISRNTSILTNINFSANTDIGVSLLVTRQEPNLILILILLLTF